MTTINIRNQAQTKSRGKITIPKRMTNTKIPFKVDSEITIYKNTVKNGMEKKGSSSSEDEWIINSSDKVNNSDETMDEDCANSNGPKAIPDIDTHGDNDVLENKIDQFISEQR